MSAERLREAAVLMRARAEDALDVAWDHIGGGRVSGWVDGYGEAAVCDARRKGDADHIASWDPAVALAVADWLDQCAAIREEAADGPLAMAMRAVTEPADAVANAYLSDGAS